MLFVGIPRLHHLESEAVAWEEERVLYRGVPEGAPKDWRRDTLKEYLREHHAAFELQKRDMVDDESSDEDMEDLYVYEAQFEDYFNRYN